MSDARFKTIKYGKRGRDWDMQIALTAPSSEPSICASLGRCAYDVANEEPNGGCPWWSDCFGEVEST